MRKSIKVLVSLMLAVCILCTSTVSVFAASEEEYLSDLRLVYADSYKEAKEFIKSIKLDGYQVLDENLNSNTGETGVWLAYKITTDIEDAITDISVMQMDGGYKAGNYEEMIEESKAEYKEMGLTYLTAIEYFADAYDEGDFRAVSAYRQLNFYSGLDNYEDEKLGDIFVDGLNEAELATMFMEGNANVLSNVRSLISMGVSYNEDGKTYLEKVADEAAAFGADESIYDDEDYHNMAVLIAPTILTFQDMFKELQAYEAELNYLDEEITDKEIEYAEYKAIADMMRPINYLNGKTLYDFCLSYVEDEDEEDYTMLYPLVAALNEGQYAMASLAHFYDVVRYSMSAMPEDLIEEELAELEETYGENPFDIYTGVDRSIYKGTFALTSEAYRADAYTSSGLAAHYFDKNGLFTGINIAVGAIGTPMFAYSIARAVKGNPGAAPVDADDIAEQMAYEIKQATSNASYDFSVLSPTDAIGNGAMGSTKTFAEQMAAQFDTVDAMVDAMLKKYDLYSDQMIMWSFKKKFNALTSSSFRMTSSEKEMLLALQNEHNSVMTNAKSNLVNAEVATKQAAADKAAAAAAFKANIATGVLMVVGGLMMLYSAGSLLYTYWSYYHPEYEDIPEEMVDLIETEDGDRYIKYDVVYEAETDKEGNLMAGDLNAFSAERWNALYYTKSYEAGKPLLADFALSKVNNTPDKGYAPVHRFGEVVSYNLNKYNFKSKCDSIYLSVKQSKNDKYAATGVPEIVGSVFSDGYIFLALGIGLIVGVGGTLAVQKIIKKKKVKD